MSEPGKTPSRKPIFVGVQMPAAGYIPLPIAHICLSAGYRLLVTFQFSLPFSFLLREMEPSGHLADPRLTRFLSGVFLVS